MKDCLHVEYSRVLMREEKKMTMTMKKVQGSARVKSALALGSGPCSY